MAKKTGKKLPTLYDLFHKNPLNGKGVSKADTVPRNFKNFFKLSWWHIGTIVSVNLVFLLGNFPMFFGLLGISGLLSDTWSTASSAIFANVFGAFQGTVDPYSAAIYGIHGMPGEMLITSNATRVMFVLTLLLVFTWGFVNIGTTYILRNLIKGEPIFFFHDFFYAIKRNLRQGFFMGMIDLALIALAVFDIITLSAQGSLLKSFMFYFILFLAIIYMAMRFYIYNLIITFDLSLFKIIKNAFIFSSLAWKRNAVGMLGIGVLFVITWYLVKFLTPVGIMVALVLLYGYSAYIGSYVAWPKIKAIMVDPYEPDEPEDGESTEEDAKVTEDTETVKEETAPIFKDDVPSEG